MQTRQFVFPFWDFSQVNYLVSEYKKIIGTWCIITLHALYF